MKTTVLKNKKERGKKKLSVAQVVFIAIVATILIVYILSQVVVLGWGLLTSLKHAWDFEAPVNNILGLPNLEYSYDQVFKLSNYGVILKNFNIERRAAFYVGNREVVHSVNATMPLMLLNSVIYVLIGSFLLTMVPCIVAYLCEKYKYFFSKIIYTVVIIVMAIPLIGTESSAILLLRNLGLYDTYLGMAVQNFSFCGGMYFLVFYSTFRGLSDTYTEAAEIDGASQFRILVSIALPLVWKMIATVFLLRAVAYWNDYQTPLLYFPTKPTFSYGIYAVTSGAAKTTGEMSHVPVRVAGCMLLALPMLLIFILFNNQLMGNISMGGIKE